MSVAYVICNITIIYILCFVVIVFICISIIFDIIRVGCICIVYVMCIFVVLFFSNAIMVFIYDRVIFAKQCSFIKLNNDSRPLAFSSLIIHMS